MNAHEPQGNANYSPSIAIVTATLNSERDLPVLLDSLSRQTDTNFDLILVDGASNDSTWSIIQANRSLVTHAVSEPDHGLYDALNKGIRASRAEFYLVVGADDTLNPDAVANYRSVAVTSNADVIVASVQADGRIRQGFRRDRAWLGHSAMVTSHSVGMMFRRSLHDRFGFYSLRYPVLADGLFIKRVCTAADVKVNAAPFVAGVFGTTGSSNKNLARALFESWQIQLDTGENALLQYLLFQSRLLKNLPKILGGSWRRTP